MEVKFFGANCVQLVTKQRTVTVDDNLVSLGAKSVIKESDTLFYTSKHIEPSPLPKVSFIMDIPGEFELGNMMIQGYAVRSHMDEPKQRSGVLYKFVSDRTTVVVAGHIHPEVDADFLESLGVVDVLILPVGGHGYTLDAVGALRVSNKINPRYLVPTHYADSGLSYEVPQDALEVFLTELKQETETLDSLKFKGGFLGEVANTQVVILNRQ